MSGGRIVYSSTGTAPIVVTPYGPGLVSLDFEDGSGQVYRVSELLAALGGAVDVEPAPEWPEVTQAEWERECDRAYRAALGDVEPAGVSAGDVTTMVVTSELGPIMGPTRPAVPVPSWANVATSSRWEAGERGEVFRFHEADTGAGVTVSQHVAAGPAGVRVEPAAVLVSLRGGSEVLGAGEARELAAALVRGAELVEAIGAES